MARIELPEGFILDKPSLPEGFVLDTEKTEIKPKIVPEISAAKTPLNLKPIKIEEQAKLANIAAIARMSGRNISEVAKEYEGKTAETGLRRTFDIGMHRDPTSKQLVEAITYPYITGAIGAGMVTQPLTTLKSLAIAAPLFKGIDLLTLKGVKKLPEGTPQEVKEIIETGGYLGGMWVGGKILEKAPQAFALLKQKSLIRKSPKLMREATEEYRNILRPTQGEVKNIEIRKGKDINDFYRIAAEEQLPIKQTSDKKIDTFEARRILTERSNRIRDILHKFYNEIPADKQKTFDLIQIGEKAKKELKTSILNASELKDALKEVDIYITDEISRFGRFVDVKKLDTVKQGMWSVGYNMLKPTSKSVARKIGHIAKESIEQSYPQMNIRQTNELLAKYATLSDLLENAQGRVIQGGRMGRYFAKTIGAIAGSKIPIAGPIAGQYLGGKAADYLAAPERAALIASKKAQKAGMVGKSFNEVVNFVFADVVPEAILQTPTEIPQTLRITKQNLLEYKPVSRTPLLGNFRDFGSAELEIINSRISGLSKTLPILRKRGMLNETKYTERQLQDLLTIQKKIFQQIIESRRLK